MRIVSTDALAAEMTAFAQTEGGMVSQETLNGTRAVVVTYPDGSKLYVANTGPAYPLRLVMTGRGAGMADFSVYNGEFRITAPENALDLSSG